jgi:hypothetical protein
MINKETKEWAPVPRFLNIPQIIEDVKHINDTARSRRFSNLMMGLSLLRNYKPFEAPKSLALIDILKKFDKTFALTGTAKKKGYGDVGPQRDLNEAMKRRQDPWNFLFVAGMWFQDLFNYDFRRTEMCIIPYGTQEGEISFCAYNTGIGWRKIIENMYKNATVAQWYKTHGKHQIYAAGRKVDLDTYEHHLKIDAADAARVRAREHDVPMTAAEEDKMRRRAAQQAAEVRRIYEEMVLKKPNAPVVQIGSMETIKQATGGSNAALLQIKPNGGNGASATKSVEAHDAETVAGD